VVVFPQPNLFVSPSPCDLENRKNRENPRIGLIA